MGRESNKGVLEGNGSKDKRKRNKREKEKGRKS